MAARACLNVMFIRTLLALLLLGKYFHTFSRFGGVSFKVTCSIIGIFLGMALVNTPGTLTLILQGWNYSKHSAGQSILTFRHRAFFI